MSFENDLSRVDSAAPVAKRSMVLVVDDDERMLRAYSGLFASIGHETEIARDGLEAIHRLGLKPDLVVLDANMPHLDGYEVARRIRRLSRGSDLPIIMVTGHVGREDRLRALEVGIDDFLAKPFDTVMLRLRAQSLIALKRARDELRSQKEGLEREVRERTAALRGSLDRAVAAERRLYRAHVDTIRRLVSATESRDVGTGEHVQRIGRYSRIVARAIGMSPGQVELVGHSAPLHDLGKLGVPDRVLRKEGPLDEEEWALMRRHPEIGHRILADAPSRVLQMGARIALSHHERWDGKGYPKRLVGVQIPIEGRICAVVDVFDAVTSPRPYRHEVSFEVAAELIREGSGSQFDPDVVDAFGRAIDEVKRVHESVTSEPIASA